MWRVVNEVKFLPVCLLSCFSHVRVRVRLFETLWTVVPQASPSMGFSRQEYWSRLPFPSPGDIPNQELNAGLLHRLRSQAGFLPLAPPRKW